MAYQRKNDLVQESFQENKRGLLDKKEKQNTHYVGRENSGKNVFSGSLN